MPASIERIQSPPKWVREISSIAFGRAKSGLIMMYRAYFDGSGKKDCQFVTVAGYLAPSKKWEKIETEWQRALNEFGLKNLHMSDFSKPEHRRGLDLKSVFSRFATIVNTWTEIGIASSVDTAAFTETLSPLNKKTFGEPYCAAALLSVACVEDWARRHSYEGPIAYVFEDGDRKHEFTKAYDSGYRLFPKELRSLVFAPKAVLPLQAADMLAYTVNRDRRTKPSRQHWSDCVKPLLERGSIDNRWYSTEQLQVLDANFAKILETEPDTVIRLFGDKIRQGRRTSRPVQ